MATVQAVGTDAPIQGVCAVVSAKDVPPDSAANVVVARAARSTVVTSAHIDMAKHSADGQSNDVIAVAHQHIAANYA
nr:hypothetical protein [Caulobacter sp. BP25]